LKVSSRRFRVCLLSGAGEGPNADLRHRDWPIPTRLQPHATTPATAASSSTATGAVQLGVPTASASAPELSATMVRRSRAVRGTPFCLSLSFCLSFCLSFSLLLSHARTVFHFCVSFCTRSCSQPLITPAEAGIDATQTQIDEERALCIYVRAIFDERVQASRCFATLTPFPPPPPPMPQSVLSRIQIAIRRRKVRRGRSAGAESKPSESETREYIDQHTRRHQQVNQLLDRLSNENFQLRDVLSEIRPKLLDPTVQGRRLFERLEGTRSHNFEENIKRGELSVGNGALMSLTVAQCSTLCEALVNETDPSNACNGIAYRMLDPSDAANLQTAYCYLLRTTGACTPNDFAVSIFSRRDTSGCRTPTREDNPMCVQLAPSRADTVRLSRQWLEYAALTAALPSV
jgi:hypothetical protein